MCHGNLCGQKPSKEKAHSAMWRACLPTLEAREVVLRPHLVCGKGWEESWGSGVERDEVTTRERSRGAHPTASLPFSEKAGVPSTARITNSSMASGWNISGSEGKSKDTQLLVREPAGLRHARPWEPCALPDWENLPRVSRAWTSFPSPYMLLESLGPLSRRKQPQATRGTGRHWWGALLKAMWGGSRTHRVCRLGTAAYINRAGDSDSHLFLLSPLGALS